jgi:DNA polymerase I
VSDVVDGADLVSRLRERGAAHGTSVGLAYSSRAIGLAGAGWHESVATDQPWRLISQIDTMIRPRWVVWSIDTATSLVEHVRLATCWDIAAVHRLLCGGWRADVSRSWAAANGLDLAAIPTVGPVDLFTPADDGDSDEPVLSTGYLRPDWVDGGWAEHPERLGRWASLALDVAARQEAQLAALTERPRARATARSESAAELLCAELQADGLPMNRLAIEEVIAGFIGPRPRDHVEADELRRDRDAKVLAHVPEGMSFDLRSPLQVKSLLRSIGVEVPDTRAWRLESLQDAHPMIAELLAWRKAERILTTFGYGWIDTYMGPDDRLRGSWSGCDGAAGRMTATAGLHNMPTELRAGVVAEPGYVFVRADLGQIEPRVLAVVSGDGALAKAAGEGDMYAPVAERLGVERAIAKVAVLGAMYGQTTGKGAEALKNLTSAYPVAMSYLDAADRNGQAGRSIRTYGGRLIRMHASAEEASAQDARSRAAAQGRYGRNAMVQGAAAEFFKVWAVTVRARCAALDARIVLCLHDELLVHVPAVNGVAMAALLEACLEEATRYWARGTTVRFVSDTSVISRWADAK